MGGSKISSTLGQACLDWVLTLHEEAHGNADFVAHFYRRAFDLIRTGGAFGLIATNTIAQGDTRGTGLRWICKHGGEEVNTSPTHAHHRYVINFGERSEEDCRRRWPELMAMVEAKVKPERAKPWTGPWSCPCWEHPRRPSSRRSHDRRPAGSAGAPVRALKGPELGENSRRVG